MEKQKTQENKLSEYQERWYNHIEDFYSLGWNLETMDRDKVKTLMEELKKMVDIADKKRKQKEVTN